MRLRTKRTIASSLVLILLAITALVSATHTEAYAQFMESYKALSTAEQQWVRRHPIAAFRTHHLADTARALAKEHKNDPELDGDLDGGMADAFKHTLWMALTAQKIGRDKAISLGKAHEDGNYEQFLNNPERSGGLIQDKATSDMDLYNNNIGAQIGQDYPNASISVLIFLVKDAVTKGQCRKILKDSQGKYLDAHGGIIDTGQYNGQWEIPKVLIPSNKQETNQTPQE